MLSFRRFFILFFIVVCGYAQANQLSSQEEEDIKKKLLFKGKTYYEKHLSQKNEENENTQKSQKETKVYKRQDGSIDTFKTFNKTKE